MGVLSMGHGTPIHRAPGWVLTLVKLPAPTETMRAGGIILLFRQFSLDAFDVPVHA